MKEIEFCCKDTTYYITAYPLKFFVITQNSIVRFPSKEKLSVFNMTRNDEIAICHWSRFNLLLSFLWPISKKEQLNPSKWFYIRLGIFIILVFVPLFFMVTMHILKSLGENKDISEDLSIMAAALGLMLLMILFGFEQKNLAQLLKDMSDFKEFGKPSRFEETNKIFDFYAKFIYVYGIVGTTTYNIVKLIQIPHCKKEKSTTEICGMVIPIWLPFSLDSWPMFTIVAILIFVAIIIVDKITMLVSIQMLEISFHLKLRIEQLNSMILQCFDEDKEASAKRLLKCIRYHIQIINFSTRFNSCFTNGMFVHFATTGVICGCIENQFIKSPEVGPFLHLFGWIASLFIVCYAGQVLIDSSLSIPDAIFASQWYLGDTTSRKNLIFMLQRSQKPMFIRTGPYNFLSFELFVSIMKLSYSILTLLE